METIVRKDVAVDWVPAADVSDIPEESGACIRFGHLQIAIFNFTSRGEWYAVQNQCPHKLEMALSRGLIGDSEDEPKVVCPFHKKTFSLITGAGLNDPLFSITTYKVKIKDGIVFVGIPKE